VQPFSYGNQEPSEDYIDSDSLPMQVFVRLNFLDRRTLTLMMRANDTVGYAKAQIHRMEEKAPRREQRLIFNSMDLMNRDTMAQHGIVDGSTMDCHMRLCGGAKRPFAQTTREEELEICRARAMIAINKKELNIVVKNLCMALLNDTSTSPISDKLINLSQERLEELSHVIDATYGTPDKFISSISLFVVPEIKEVEKQMGDLERARETLRLTFNVMYATEYLSCGKVKAFNHQMFKRVVEERLTRYKSEQMMQREIEARVNAAIVAERQRVDMASKDMVM
jgi:hypothetical protein